MPENFLDFFAAILATVGLIFGFLSVWEKFRPHTTRLLAIFFLFSIALFANNAACYFAALFIIATAITELEFLQNLAAIIRGSKEYFDYKKEFMSPVEVTELVSAEEQEIEKYPEATDASAIEELSQDFKNLSSADFYMLCEEYAFKHLEQRYKKPIEKHVRYRGKNFVTELDGVMTWDNVDFIFEIKASRRNKFPFNFVKKSTIDTAEKVQDYIKITKRNARLQMVIISGFEETGRSKFQELKVILRTKHPNISVDFDFLTFADIGLHKIQSDIKAISQ